MAVTHVLKDGTVLKDINGHVVRIEDARVIYEILDRINKEKQKGAENEHQI